MISNDEKNPAEYTGGWQDLLAKQREEGPGSLVGNERKTLIGRRLMLLDERFERPILDQIADTYNQKDVKVRLKHHVNKTINIADDITSVLACVYDQYPRRRLKDGSEEEQAALIALDEATFWRRKVKEVNRKAWFAGPVLEVPYVDPRGEGALQRDVVTGDCFDIQCLADDPLGHPIAAAYHWQEGARQVIKVIDRTHVRIFTTGGELITQWEHGVSDADGAPMFPGTLWRYDCPTDVTDYWCASRNERLTDATIEAGVQASVMSWVRKSQNRKWVVLMGAIDQLNVPAGQDAEVPGFWNVDEAHLMPKVEVADLNTPVTQFVEHIMFLYRSQIESYGIPQSALTFDFGVNGSGGPASVMQLSLQHDKKTKLRNDQIVFALEAERRSQYCLVATAKAAGLAIVAALPEMADFAERLEIEFPELTRIEDPKTRHAELEWQLKRGLITDAHIYQMSHPELTLEEAKARVLVNLEAQAEFNELKAARNMDPAAEMLDRNEATGGMRADPEPEPETENETLEND